MNAGTSIGLAALTAALMGIAQPVHAQRPAAQAAPHVEISAGAVMMGGTDFGATTADLTGNEPSGPALPLFRTTTSLGTGRGADGRVAWLFGRRFAVEGGVIWVRQTLESRISSDIEDVPDVTLAQDLDTYMFEASGVLHLTALEFAGGRGVPFISGGGGYMRQLDEESLLVGTGEVYHAGGGVKYFFGPSRGVARGFGIRADARLSVLSGGAELEEGRQRRTVWRVGAGGLVRF